MILLDDLGNQALVQLDEVAAHTTTGTVLERSVTAGEPGIHLTLVVCLTQREKFEWILQKGTELGAAEFQPVISSRSLVQKGDDAKMERWQRILKEAAEQCGRGRIPLINKPVKWEACMKGVHPGSLNLILWEEEEQAGFRQVIQQNREKTGFSLLIGPEGGLTEDEVLSARGAGFIPVSMGRRILRMETAAIAAAAVVMYELGEMDPRSDQTAG